jgi:hypothetical protein
MGGAFSLATSFSLFDNVSTVSKPYAKSDIQYFRHAGFILAISILAVIAGFAIYKVQSWSLPLAGSIAIVVIGYWISRPRSDLFQADILTIVVPMAAILIWVSLPSTWLEFRRHGEKAS